MALTVRKGPAKKVGDEWRRTVRIVFDSSYPTAGEALTPANLGFDDNGTELEVVQLAKTVTASTTFVVVVYDGEAEKLQAFGHNASGSGIIELDEIGSTDDLSATPVFLHVYGRRPTSGV